MSKVELSQIDYSKLSKKQKLELLDALEEKKRRKRAKGTAYVPNDGQLKVHKDKSRERYVFSGNGAGKTTLLCNEVIWAANGINPISGLKTKVPANIVVVLDSPEKVSAKVIPEMKKWTDMSEVKMEKLGKPYIAKITFKNGSTVNFMFFDQDQFKFEGIDGIDFIGSDEPMPRDRYVALIRGTREKHSDPRILIVGTPISQAWLRKEVYVPWSRGERPDTMCFRFHTDVNIDNLRDGFIEEFSSRLSEQEKLIRLAGHFADLEGLALADLWEPEKHLIDTPTWPNGWPCVVSIDPHPRKKHIAVLMGITRDNEYRVLKEFSSRSVPSQFAQELRNWYHGHRIVDIVCDSLGSSPMSGGDGNKSFIQVLNENGVRARATTFDDKNDEAWIQKIQEALAIPPEPDNFGRCEPRLKIVRNCLGLISDIENVQWQKNRGSDYLKPKLDIADQDYLACLKYALATQPSFNKNKERRLKSKAPSPWSGAGGSNLTKEKPRSSYFGAARSRRKKRWK